jgi:hypothetical protein
MIRALTARFFEYRLGAGIAVLDKNQIFAVSNLYIGCFFRRLGEVV